MMRFIDKAPISGTRKTSDGYLVAEVKTARTGIQLYAGYEVGKPTMDVVRVYRPDDQVFSKDSLASYAHKPVTNDHPDEAVTSDNWKELSVGQIGDEVARDGDYVRVPLVVMDATTIKLVEDGKQELSAGYSCDLSFEAGTTPQGETFDAVQRDIKINHVAIVDRGRAGSTARIGDNAVKSWGISPYVATDKRTVPMETRKITVDGIPVETNDAGATVIEKLVKDKATLETKIADAIAAHVKAIADKDAELAKKDAELDAAKGKVLDDAALDAAVTQRADLIAAAKSVVADVETKGKSAADIRKEVVTKKLGDAAVKDKSEAYIDARFDILVEDADSTETVRDAITNRVVSDNMNVADGQKAEEASRQKMLDRFNRNKKSA